MSPVMFRFLCFIGRIITGRIFLGTLENVPAALGWVLKFSAAPQWFEVVQSRRTDNSGDS
jgi:hypothetical protein